MKDSMKDWKAESKVSILTPFLKQTCIMALISLWLTMVSRSPPREPDVSQTMKSGKLLSSWVYVWSLKVSDQQVIVCGNDVDLFTLLSFGALPRNWLSPSLHEISQRHSPQSLISIALFLSARKLHVQLSCFHSTFPIRCPSMSFRHLTIQLYSKYNSKPMTGLLASSDGWSMRLPNPFQYLSTATSLIFASREGNRWIRRERSSFPAV